MAEGLLSFSNIDLFGHILRELKVLDPERPIKVDAATIDHLPTWRLRGAGPIDGVNLVDGMRVLVWKQKYGWRNGVYKVAAVAAAWVFKEERVQNGGFVLVKNGNTLGDKVITLDNALSIPGVFVQFSVPNRTTAGSLASLQISVDGIEILNAPVVWAVGDTKAEFIANVVDEINREQKMPFYAERIGSDIAIFSPSDLQEEYIGKNVSFTRINIDNMSDVKFDEGEDKINRLFSFVGKRFDLRNRRRGENRELDRQIRKDSRFARIYGFSFEGTYYDLPRPLLFLVHGDGDLVTTDSPQDTVNPHLFRAPGATSLTGLASADFDFADGLRVWSYDKADYTIRMEVETGMFEQVLLDAMLGGSGGMEASGFNAKGFNARGFNARGFNARGFNARGFNARGGGNSD